MKNNSTRDELNKLMIMPSTFESFVGLGMTSKGQIQLAIKRPNDRREFIALIVAAFAEDEFLFADTTLAMSLFVKAREEGVLGELMQEHSKDEQKGPSL